MRRALTAAVAGVGLTAVVGIGVAAAAGTDGPAGRIADVLAGLVSDGTITQDQADAVGKALADAQDQAREERSKEWAEKRAEHQQERAERQAELDAMLQKTIGKTWSQVRDELAGGKTLKEIAGDKADALAAAALDLVEERAAAAVTQGRLTQDQADTVVKRAKEQADAWLSGDDTQIGRGLGMLLGLGSRGHGMGGPGFGGKGHGWGGPEGQDGADPAPRPSGSASSASLHT